MEGWAFLGDPKYLKSVSSFGLLSNQLTAKHRWCWLTASAFGAAAENHRKHLNTPYSSKQQELE